MKNQPYLTQVESLSSKPVEIRQSTDRFFILLFPINLVLWLGLGIYYMIPYLRYFTSSAIEWFIFAGLQVAAAMVIIFLAFISNKLRMKMVFVIMFFFAVGALLIVLLIYTEIRVLMEAINFFTTFKDQHFTVTLLVILIFSVVWLMYHLLILLRIKVVDKALLTQMINEPNRAILGSLSTLLFSIPMVVVFTIILMFNVNMTRDQLLNYEILNYHDDSELSYWKLLRFLTFVFASTYIFNFVYNFGLMVMGDFFTHYFNTPGHQKGSYILQSIRRVLRYHLGTVSFLSTPMLPFLCALVVAFKKNQQSGKKSGFTITNFFSKLWLIMDITDYVSMQTSINGHPALKSVKEMFDLQHSNSLNFLMANAASLKLTEIATLMAAIIKAILLILLYYIHNSWDYMILMEFLFHDVIWSMLYLNVMSKFLIRPAMCTFSIYKMENLRESAALEESSHLEDVLET